MQECMLKKFEEKLDEQIEKFLDQISSECRQGFEYDRWQKREYISGFPILGLAEEKYYHNKQQEAILEWRVRDELVNKIFDYLFKTHGYDIRWRIKDYCETTGGYSNEENEKEFPVEFFIVKDGKFLAYRYSAFTADYSIPDNLPNYFYRSYYQTGVEKIEKWYQIVWEEVTDGKLEEKFQNQITVEKLFEEYFSKREFTLYIDKVQKAVALANKLMGFQTIQKLESENLALFKEKIINEFPDICKMNYWKITEQGSVTSEVVNISWNDNDIKKVQSNFETKQRNLALIGGEKFAQSFVTSEYLYRIFKEESILDYTAVVCGYIKSVEQLCESIIFNVLPKLGLDLYYQARHLEKSEKSALCKLKELETTDKKWKVLMREGNQKYFDKMLTMGELFSFLGDHGKEIFDIESEITTNQMVQCMKNYCTFDRNGYLHKHNISKLEVVERIRNNTLVISYWLLGGIRMTGDKKTNKTALGILDFSFDRLFKKIAYRHEYKYIFDFGDGIMHKVVKIPQISKYFFDEKGVLQDAELIFIEVEEYPVDFLEFRNFLDKQVFPTDKIIVDKNHLPLKIWWINKDGTKELVYRRKRSC